MQAGRDVEINLPKPMIDDLLKKVMHVETYVEEELGGNRSKLRSARKALSMFREAAHNGTPAKVEDTLNTVRLLAPTDVLEAIEDPVLAAQKFVYIKTGNIVEIDR